MTRRRGPRAAEPPAAALAFAPWKAARTAVRSVLCTPELRMRAVRQSRREPVYPRPVSSARHGTDARPPAPSAAPVGAAAVEAVASVAGDAWVACAACGGFVADVRARISINGAQSHSFINPLGLIFRVGCFAEAPGVAAVGEASDYFTWFAGFAWRVALCRACGAHLGWSYRNAAEEFVALIEDRVVERRAPDSPSTPS